MTLPFNVYLDNFKLKFIEDLSEINFNSQSLNVTLKDIIFLIRH